MKTMMKIKYVGSKGTLHLDDLPYLYKSHDFMDYERNFDTSPMLNGRGESLDGITKKSKEYKMVIHVIGSCQSQEWFADRINDLTEFFDADIEIEKAGRLYVNDEYIECYIKSSKKGKWIRGLHHIEIEFTVFAPKPYWITEVPMTFLPMSSSGGESDAGKGYVLSYPYSYSGGGTMNLVENNSVYHSLAIITIYGYAKDPVIKIGDRIYKITGTIQADERVVINQIDRTIQKVFNTGQTENWFNKRGKEESVFAPIPPGKQPLIMSGAFGVDLTLHIERSEPRWK